MNRSFGLEFQNEPITQSSYHPLLDIILFLDLCEVNAVQRKHYEVEPRKHYREPDERLLVATHQEHCHDEDHKGGEHSQC